MKAEKWKDDSRVAELAKRLREKTKPLCPQFRSCDVEWLLPVRGYCALSRSPGWFMVPRLVESRTYCTSQGFAGCPWFLQADEAVVPGHGRLESPAGSNRDLEGPDAGE
jgi:hypothetical protein